MGRKPNPLILEYFERGPKLNDNSNRYPHTCKQCGENFPKGRIDSLTTHITKKCPAISDSDRMRACLELHGIASAKAALPVSHPPTGAQVTSQQLLSELPQGWSALETLAEASRQVDLNENNRVNHLGQEASNPANLTNPTNGEHTSDRFEVQEQFTLDNPPGSYDGRAPSVQREPAEPTPPATELTPEERLQAFLPVSVSSPDAANISVAVAATARLNPSLLDPQLVDNESVASPPQPPQPPPPPPPTEATPTPTVESAPPATATTVESTIAVEPNNAQPWGEISYLTSALPMTMIPDAPHPHAPMLPQPHRGGVRMDAFDGTLNGKPRHARSRFNPTRRKEVQEVRKIGACIRCRILRKNCGTGDPCDTCRKVLAPRVWRTGCVRTRLHEQLDLYSAGVQVVLSQNRINMMKTSLRMFSHVNSIELSHFPETPHKIVSSTLGAHFARSEHDDNTPTSNDGDTWFQILMIDQDAVDLPLKVEAYMRDVMSLFIERETSKFMRITLETAVKMLETKENDLLKKSLDLWGFVESIDRERQWVIKEIPMSKGEEPKYIKETHDENEADIYTMMCMQLNAAAERRANGTSKSLLALMHRILQDSKIKVGFGMYLTAIIFLNCVEKSTWAFKAWEQDHLRPGWPLERDPSVFTEQGGNLASLLRMLLGIRKVLPQTIRREGDGKLATVDADPEIARYFEEIDLDYDTIVTRQKGSQFSPADSRSLELVFCSHLLLPNGQQ